MENIIIKGWIEPLIGRSICCVDVLINDKLITVWTCKQFIFEHPKRNNSDLRIYIDGGFILLNGDDGVVDAVVDVNQLHKNHIKKVARKILNVPNDTKVTFK